MVHPSRLVMSTALRWFFRGFLLLFVAVELVAIAASLFAPDVVAGGEETRWGMLAFGVIGLVVTIAQWTRTDPIDEATGGIEKQAKAKREREARVQSAGLSARAMIVARENEREDEGQVDADLTLEIHVAGRAPYRVPYLWSEPERHVEARMHVGRALEAKVDPADPSFVVVRWDDGRWYSTRRL